MAVGYTKNQGTHPSSKLPTHQADQTFATSFSRSTEEENLLLKSLCFSEAESGKVRSFIKHVGTSMVPNSFIRKYIINSTSCPYKQKIVSPDLNFPDSDAVKKVPNSVSRFRPTADVDLQHYFIISCCRTGRRPTPASWSTTRRLTPLSPSGSM